MDEVWKALTSLPPQTDEYGVTIWRDIDGRFHRDNDRPAIIFADGTKEYWIDGHRHREHGPAIEWADGTVSHYINDERLTKKQWEKYVKENKIRRT